MKTADFVNGPGILMHKTYRPCINSTWIALLLHEFVPVKPWLLIFLCNNLNLTYYERIVILINLLKLYDLRTCHLNDQIVLYTSYNQGTQEMLQSYRENHIIASGQVWAKFYVEQYRKTSLLLQYIFIHKGYHSCANGSVILIISTLWRCKSQMSVFKGK